MFPKIVSKISNYKNFFFEKKIREEEAQIIV